jgi:hypothetical protein
LTALFAVLEGIGVAARAQPEPIDFENLAVGTVVTTQYPGVTFSAPPGSCGGAPPVNCVIVSPGGGTSSGTHALSVTTGCPDFSPDYIRMVFDEGHAEVSFTLGHTAGTYNVRAYTTVAGGAPVISQNVVLSGSGFIGVHRFVRLTRAAPDIRRVEIEDTISDFEVIDDLFVDCPDSTAPLAEITSPGPLDCFCYGGEIQGTADDPDGELDFWRLDRRAVDSSTWVLIRTSTTPVANGYLSNWFPAASAGEGYYILRLAVTNKCGEETVTETVVHLERGMNTLRLRSPVTGAIVGGDICIDGTIWDWCSGTLAVERRPVGGAWSPVTTVSPPWVINDPLGYWNTRAGVADGNYEIRITGTNLCGSPESVSATVTVDNTPPVAALLDPARCAYLDGIIAIRGTATDAHLAGWTLQYTGGDAQNWVTIASGNAPVVNGVLGFWDARDLPHCAYTLRLVVTDQAVLDCNSVLHNQRETMVSLNIGPLGDMNCDGVVNNFDIDAFVSCISTGDCTCP